MNTEKDYNLTQLKVKIRHYMLESIKIVSSIPNIVPSYFLNEQNNICSL